MNYCHNCGENVKGQKFCTKCGTKVLDENILNEVKKEEVQTGDNGKVLMLVDVGLLTAFVAICVASAVFSEYILPELENILSGVLVPLGIGIYVVTITGRVKYRKNPFFLIVLIIAIIATVAYLILMILVVLTCVSCINSLGEMGMVLH